MICDRSLSWWISGVVFTFVLMPLDGAAQNAADISSGVELVSTSQGTAIRFPVTDEGGSHGYLHFSANDIRYEVVYPAKDKERSFSYPRTDLSLAYEYYRTAR